MFATASQSRSRFSSICPDEEFSRQQQWRFRTAVGVSEWALQKLTGKRVDAELETRIAIFELLWMNGRTD